MTGDYLFNVGSLEDDVYIDAEDFDVANWARFMNHADTDDAGNNLQVLFDCEKSTVWFVARRPIMSNEELRYRCGLDLFFNHTHFDAYHFSNLPPPSYGEGFFYDENQGTKTRQDSLFDNANKDEAHDLRCIPKSRRSFYVYI